VLVTDLENELVIEPFYSAKVHLVLEAGSRFLNLAGLFKRSIALVDEFPDGSKRFVKSLVNIFVISLRIKTRSQRVTNNWF
jgi:hypothetical protein